MSVEVYRQFIYREWIHGYKQQNKTKPDIGRERALYPKKNIPIGLCWSNIADCDFMKSFVLSYLREKTFAVT